jgi:hypothetical protein
VAVRSSGTTDRDDERPSKVCSRNQSILSLPNEDVFSVIM